MNDLTIYAIAIVFLGVLGGLCWVTWLYLMAYKRIRELERDNYRLIRRLGMYHSISLASPTETLPPPNPEATIPAAFRNKRPVPPPGYRPDRKHSTPRRDDI